MNTSTVALPLRGRDGVHVGWTLVDAEDAKRIGNAPLYRLAGSNGANYYVIARVHGKMDALHRILKGCTIGDGVEVDHINGDKLDNRRCNLRVATRAQNGMNRVKPNIHTGLMGVVPAKGGAYKASYRTRSGEIVSKVFTNRHAAAMWRDSMVLETYGEYPRLNVEEGLVNVKDLDGRRHVAPIVNVVVDGIARATGAVRINLHDVDTFA